MIVEEQPEFPGGLSALMKYLIEKIEYPQLAIDNDVEGTVYVSFIVGKDGTIGDVSIQRSIGYGCDEAAKKVVESMPVCKPGKQLGKAVKVKMMIPIRFKMPRKE